MKKEDVLKQYTTPTGAPAFVPGPHRFTSREYLNITYRTDREALVKQVPEPLEVDEPLVRFEVMNMPDTTGYGSYVECGQAAVVRHKEEVGEYIIGMYLDNPASKRRLVPSCENEGHRSSNPGIADEMLFQRIVRCTEKSGLREYSRTVLAPR
jgi:acetoacetate decarboxylase